VAADGELGGGGRHDRSLEELHTLLERLDRHPRLGLCLDSCHLYVSGYDVTDRRTVDALVGELDEKIGLDRLRALHVNDSAAELGSNRDRHANIGEGLIGEGLGAFVSHPAFQHLSAYLEVPGENKRGPDANELQKLRDLHARWV
jgi:deoxyribonuclease IV